MGDFAGGEAAPWRFGPNEALIACARNSIRRYIFELLGAVNDDGPRPVVPLGHGDPSPFPCFAPAPEAVDAVAAALRSGGFNSYTATVGILPARRAIAEHLSGDLPCKLSPDDVFLTAGCNQAIDIVMSALARPGANILIPRPGYPIYLAKAASQNIEIRQFDLIPGRDWELDLEGVKALADEHTIAIVMINPNNPCGNVFTYEHLSKVAETASKLGLLVIADEVYAHETFGENPFVPMGVFGHIAPVLTLGSLSKRWFVPGWRFGWIAVNDPRGILAKKMVINSITSCLEISADPVSFIQGAIPDIIKNTKQDFFAKTVDLLKELAEICYSAITDIECITCPHKPEGCMFTMVQLDLSLLEGINDDMDFCFKLAKEESVIICPGSGLQMKNWLRVTFAVDPAVLKLGLDRLKSFCLRHRKQN